ncbi:ovocalyxin-32-like [Pogoniulus pusillus]|uniref:ovocalyxin-32-like n=1 Tax=Pogoniulus pusillus TaxID=488313 RepID=UPI0030B99BB5
MQGLSAAPSAAFLLLLLLLSPLQPAAAAGSEELSVDSSLAVEAARVALHYFNFQSGSLAALRALGQLRKAAVESIPDSGHKYYLQLTAKDYQSGVSVCSFTFLLPLCGSPECLLKSFWSPSQLIRSISWRHNCAPPVLHQGLLPKASLRVLLVTIILSTAEFSILLFQADDGSCLATVLYPKTAAAPAVTVKCTPTQDQKQIQEEDNRLYKALREQTKPIAANNIPDSNGNIDPALQPVWALAVAGSSYIMWEKSRENLGYSMVQVKSAKQWLRSDEFIEFGYIVLLREIPTQETISCNMRLTWLPDRPLKVKYSCASEKQGLDEGTGVESGSAAAILQDRAVNF